MDALMPIVLGGGFQLALVGLQAFLVKLLFERYEKYVAAFASKEGEINAIQANLEKVIAQQEKQTAAVRRIEATIEGGLWLEQERWKLKRDVYIALLGFHHRVLAAIDGRYSFSFDDPVARRAGYHKFKDAQEQNAEYLRARASAAMVLAPVMFRRLESLESGLLKLEWNKVLWESELPLDKTTMQLTAVTLGHHNVEIRQFATEAAADLGAFGPDERATFVQRKEDEDRLARILDDLQNKKDLSPADQAFYLEQTKDWFRKDADGKQA